MRKRSRPHRRSCKTAQASIGPEDEVARCVIFEKDFEDDLLSALHIVPFAGSKASERVVSVYWRQVAKTVNEVHRRGCNIAELRNDRFGQKNGHDPPPGPLRAYYCGFVEGKRRKIEKTTSDWRIAVYQKTENGDPAHAHIEFVGLSEEENDHQLGVWMTLASLHVADALRSPREHRCRCDRRDTYHPRDMLGSGYLVRRQ